MDYKKLLGIVALFFSLQITCSVPNIKVSSENARIEGLIKQTGARRAFGQWNSRLAPTHQVESRGCGQGLELEPLPQLKTSQGVRFNVVKNNGQPVEKLPMLVVSKKLS